MTITKISFIQSPVHGRYLDFFLFEAIMNKAAINIIILWHMILFLLVKYLGVKLLCFTINVHLIL